MQPNSERAIEVQKYFAAFVAMIRVFLHQRDRQNDDNSASIPRTTDDLASLDRQHIYQDPDPPTPHWGC
jgi:hypothetical protein